MFNNVIFYAFVVEYIIFNLVVYSCDKLCLYLHESNKNEESDFLTFTVLHSILFTFASVKNI